MYLLSFSTVDKNMKAKIACSSCFSKAEARFHEQWYGPAALRRGIEAVAQDFALPRSTRDEKAGRNRDLCARPRAG
jgi:hypothetical protein